MWVRGLKPMTEKITGVRAGVAPYVGAWIETPTSSTTSSPPSVAPYVGAWIET